MFLTLLSHSTVLAGIRQVEALPNLPEQRDLDGRERYARNTNRGIFLKSYSLFRVCVLFEKSGVIGRRAFSFDLK